MTSAPLLVHSPVPIAPYTDVVNIAIGDRAEYVVLASGQVRDWGFGLTGNLGNGTLATTGTHQSPLAVGGGSGTLSGVTQLSSMSHVVARRVDGSVIAWGDNGQRQVGDGSSVGYRTYPVEVYDGSNRISAASESHELEVASGSTLSVQSQEYLLSAPIRVEERPVQYQAPALGYLTVLTRYETCSVRVGQRDLGVSAGADDEQRAATDREDRSPHRATAAAQELARAVDRQRLDELPRMAAR